MRLPMLGGCLAIALACGLTGGSSVQAQPPGGGGRGMGMMGGGMGGPMTGLNLLTTPEGQKELSITDEQKGKIASLQETARSSMMDQFRSLQDVPEAERRAKFESVSRELNSTVKKDLKAILKPEQFERYEQISLQALRLRAFLQPETQAALKLTDEQKTKIEAIQSDSMGEVREAMQANQGDREASRKAMTEIQKKSFEKATAVLTDEQKAEWAKLIGKPFELPAMGGGFGGGRRPQR